ncbi:hypothetical protein V2J09_003268 [Rumex salicifolius]
MNYGLGWALWLENERFKQLQKEKEMRQRKELIKSTMLIMSSSSSSSSSSSDSESESYNYTCHHAAASAANNDRFRLLFADEVAVRHPPPHLSLPLPPQHRHLVNLSLWPAGDHKLRGEKDEEKIDRGLYLCGRLSYGDDDDDGGEAQLEEWCIADEQTPDDELQQALDWACGKGSANCTQINQKFKHNGGSCYFNSAAIITGQDPSYGGCKYEYLP